MKNKKLLLIVIAVIIGYYGFNGVVESKKSAHFIVDSCTSGFIDALPNYSKVVESFFSTGSITKEFIHSNYPPLYQLESALIIHAIGNSWQLLNFVHNGFYLALLIVFIYLLGDLIADHRTGLIAAVMVSLYPLTYAAFDKFCIDFPLMAIITMNIYCLIKSDYFSDSRWSILVGLMFCYGMLMKEPYGAFMIGPLVWGGLKAIFAAVREQRYKKLLNFSICGCIIYCILFILTHYYSDSLTWKLYGRLTEEYGGEGLFSFTNLRLFTVGWWESILSPPFFILLIPCIIYFIKKVNTDVKVMFLLWIVLPTTILFVMPHWKTARHLLPALPACALITAVGLNEFFNKKWGKVFLVIIVVIGIAQYYMFKYDLLRINEFNYNGFNYFQTGEGLRVSLYWNKSKSERLKQIAQSVYSSIHEEYGEHFRARKYSMLFISSTGDMGMGFQGIMGGYLWYAYGMDVTKVPLYKVCDALIESSKFTDSIDFVFYENCVSVNPSPLAFSMIKDNWIKSKSSISNSYALDPNKRFSWDSAAMRWDTFIASLDFHGVVARDADFITTLYTRKKSVVGKNDLLKNH